MSVIPTSVNLFQNCQDLHQFLFNCQQTLTDKVQKKIVSISLEILPVDPLAILQEICEPHQLHFYLEKQGIGEKNLYKNSLAIAAIDGATHLTVKSGNRFAQAQSFIQSCLNNTISIGATHLPYAGPHFFCSFTFFEKQSQTNLNNFHQNGNYQQKLSINPHFPSATIFLPKWQIAQTNNHNILVINTVISISINIENISQKIWDKFQQITQIKNTHLSTLTKPYKKLRKINVNHLQEFKKSVASALDLINSNSLRKIVLAHAIDIYSQTNFNLIKSLNNLRFFYPDCYVISTSNGNGQNFICASPERLISIKNNQLIADALAGSAPRGKTPSQDAKLANSLLSSEKDLREHQFVIDFIIKRLQDLGLKPNYSSQPHLLQLSNIQHLWTPITAEISQNIHLLEILAELHPTPAVAGFPRDIAQEQIQNFETFDRSLYAAPIGWIDHQGNGEFAVGIRSALINGDHARLYAGAGIVTGSKPDKELAEVQLKLQTLLKALV
ncbi:isochorismate synthase [Hydrocoleum sp. CS-953]|uniref:isochorismate synthase n=1 Tax=Hydrocoleum sp. CS-953 TaxID=1671698 RepID=UPI000B9B78F7|nr:isochorismate synthase [Hydrocoleum sp. CS-953]OZH53581.1 isochorismate synthase [Hydrocoleum sp. CS-953]